MKFEKKPRRVIYVPEQDIYRATYDSVTAQKRTPISPKLRLVGVAAAVFFWDNIDTKPEGSDTYAKAHCLGCARTIKEAYLAGDRYLLDTDDARKAAELVVDLVDTQPEDADICSALIDLSNAIAKVRMLNTPIEAFDVLQPCVDALEKCLAVPGYETWSIQSRRKRLMYELPRKYRTSVTCTLLGLLFNYGSTPLLTKKQQKELLAIPKDEGLDSYKIYMEECLRRMSAYNFM